MEDYIENVFSKRDNPFVVIRDVENELHNLKESLHAISEQKKINLKPLLAKNDELTDASLRLSERASVIARMAASDIKIELEECSKEAAQISVDFDENFVMYSTLSKIVHLHELINASVKDLKVKLFYECSVKLQEAFELTNSCQELNSLTMFTHCVQEVANIREQLLCDMTQIWSLSVQFSCDEAENHKTVTLEIDTSQCADVKQIIRAAYSLKNEEITQAFFRKLKDTVLMPLMTNESEISIQTNEMAGRLNLKIYKKKPQNYMLVFDDIISVVKFIKTFLDVEVKDRGSFVSIFGDSVGDEVTSSLVKNCLSEALPSHPGESEGFSRIVSNAEEFQASLQELNFLRPQCRPFYEGGDSGNHLFASKIYLSYLQRAREIMKKDLHSITKCKPVPSPDLSVLPATISDSIKHTFDLEKKKSWTIDLNSISNSAHEVMELAEAVTQELKKKNPDDSSVRLLFTVRNIFEMYTAIVPLHHKKLLSSLPQQVALFHNNCFYFAFNLLVLGCECLSWQDGLRDSFHVFLDGAVVLRQSAVDTLESCVTNQRSNIIAILYESGLANLRENPTLDPHTETSVRQCIRQLQLLKNVWVDILPRQVYANTMGFLIDETTQTVVAMVTDAEDISTQTCSELIKIFGIMEKRLQELFQEPKEIYRICRKWDRFQELKFILGNNLDKISERWASGMGPLAHSFSKSEAQGLIRALFKNTERRAIVLSQIYNS